ncbi:hypothetical protein [Faecalimonas sp.]
MTENNISTLFENYKQYNAELLIFYECVDELNESETVPAQYAILKRRVSLVKNWLQYLPDAESEIIKMHLVEGKSWVYISNFLASQYQGNVPCDERTLQRLQAKALKRILHFVNSQFTDKLDYLIDSAEYNFD